MNRDRLRDLLLTLERDGALSAEQRGAVYDRLAPELEPPRDRTGQFVSIVALLGAALVASGIVLFIAANWDSLGKMPKLALIFGTFLGVHHFGFALAEDPGRSPRVGRALTALGVLLFGGAIALVAQIYHLSSDYPFAILFWWSLNVPLALLTRSRAILTILIALFLLWLGWHSGAWLDHRAERDGSDFGAMFCLLGPATAALFKGLMLACERGGFPEFSLPFRLAATPLVLAGIYGLSFHDAFLESEAPGARAAAFVPAALVAIAAAVLLLPALASSRAGAREDALTGLALIAGAAALAGAIWTSPQVVHLVANAMLFGGLLVLIGVGVKRNIPAYINYGILGFLGAIITRYFEYLYEHMDPFWAFIGAGLLLLGFGWWLEQRRRGWIAAARGAA